MFVKARRLALSALYIMALILPQAAWAAVETYTLDHPHTQILFSVNHMGFSNSYGKFLDYGDAEAYRKRLAEVSEDFSDLKKEA